jgi:hypothetical protein
VVGGVLLFPNLVLLAGIGLWVLGKEVPGEDHPGQKPSGGAALSASAATLASPGAP